MLFYLLFPSDDPWEIWKLVKEFQKMWEIFKMRYVWFFLENFIGFKEIRRENHSFKTIRILLVNKPSWNHHVFLPIHIKLEKPSISINIVLE